LRRKAAFENFQLAIGQANESLAKFSLDRFGDVLDALSNLPDPVRRLGAEIVGQRQGHRYARETEAARRAPLGPKKTVKDIASAALPSASTAEAAGADIEAHPAGHGSF
jgi:hypothetical protein